MFDSIFDLVKEIKSNLSSTNTKNLTTDEVTKLEIKNKEIVSLLDQLLIDEKKTFDKYFTLIQSNYPESFLINPITPFQIAHEGRMIDILTHNKYAIDKSITGSGKTISSLMISLAMGFRRWVIVCPVIMEEGWKKYFENKNYKKVYDYSHKMIAYETGQINAFGSSVTNINREQYFIVSYESLYSHGNSKVMSKNPGKVFYNKGDSSDLTNTGLLHTFTIYEEVEGGKKNKYRREFMPTIYLKKLIQAGTFFIFDEFHKAKNESEISHAVITICNEINQTDNNSRFILQSRTPGHSAGHAKSFLHITGALDRGKPLYNVSEGRLALEDSGFRQIYEYTKEIDEEKAKRLWKKLKSLSPEDLSQTDTEDGKDAFLIKFFFIINSAMSHSMNDSIFYTIVGKDKILIKNAFFPSYPEKNKDIRTRSATIAHLNLQREEKKSGETALLGKIQTEMTEVEFAMSDSMVRYGCSILESDPNSKVIIVIKRADKNNIIDEIKSYFLSYKYYPGKKVLITPDQIGIISGSKTTKEAKRESIDQFNEHNTKLRVIIGVMGAMYQGIDLHDTSPGGKFPRFMIISPDYIITYMMQVIGRLIRIGLTSKVNIRIAYPLIYDRENKILTKALSKIFTSLQKKGTLLQDFINQEEKIDYFPDEWKNNEEMIAKDNRELWTFMTNTEIDDLDTYRVRNENEFEDEGENGNGKKKKSKSKK